jgi:hypothetical protein
LFVNGGRDGTGVKAHQREIERGVPEDPFKILRIEGF